MGRVYPEKWPASRIDLLQESWNKPEILHLLREHKAAHCPFHLAGYQSPVEITADITYIRLNGPGGNTKAAMTMRRSQRGPAEFGMARGFVYFDNDDSGLAARSALRLRELVA